jgi:UDP-N-acetylmuramate: L-alanyl-gamma-D-glutamyl-meso-diaminopimelate ligase
MRLHILGICGTFMGGIAALARELGHEVSGSDQNVYPPMSTQLERLGITLHSGYRAEAFGSDDPESTPDLVIVGNALSRGNPAVEYLLDARIPYVSGPQWLGENVLAGRRVLAVAGTHGKTTTSALLAWILQAQGRDPGFLIGGVPANFGISARLGDSRTKNRGQTPLSQARSSLEVPRRKRESDPGFSGVPFVVEADEYDTAFFDKRSKFVHYRPTIAVLNNLEFDHADIFPDLDAIKRQFHHLVRTVPGSGRLIVNAEDANLAEVLAMGCWTPVETFGIDAGDWRARLVAEDGSAFVVSRGERKFGEVRWPLLGRHNVMNALAALAAAHAAGIDVAQALPTLAAFENVARRMQLLGEAGGVRVYDDFAHHPSAIATTLAGLRAHVGAARILVALEPRSNSMRAGAHADDLAPSLRDANVVVLLQRPELPWDAARVIDALEGRGRAAASVDALLADLAAAARPGDHVVFMSNGGFEGAPRRFVGMLERGTA